MASLHEYSAKTIDGEEKKLGDYAGKVVLVVNVASRCGLTPQYAGLEDLYRRYRERGFEVLGFPCNQFASQEPGGEAEIKGFCTTKYDVTFPLFAKIEVNGGGRHPLYAYLTSATTQPDGPGDVQWNFAKFLVGKRGEVVARFGPATVPTADEVVGAIEAALAPPPP
jgi:glutathione peroxidase